jgi:hypothetical protein
MPAVAKEFAVQHIMPSRDASMEGEEVINKNGVPQVAETGK